MNSNNAFHNVSLADNGIDYPLEWLDRMVTESLNPGTIGSVIIDPQLFQEIITHLKEEDQKLQLLIKSQAFLLTEEEIGMLIRRYHSSFLMLLDLSIDNQKLLSDKEPPILQLYEALINCLDNLLEFIETWFSKYLSLDERVPPSYLAMSKSELKKRITKLTEKITAHQQIKPVLKLVLKRLNQFVNSDSLKFEVTFRSVLYKKELISKLEELSWDLTEREVYTSIHELLIYMNFNSKTYVKLLTSDILKLTHSENEYEKMDNLLYFYKAFNQIHSKPDLILNPRYHHLETILKTWYEEEISYLEKKQQLLSQGTTVAVTSSIESVKDRSKILCKLSSDQLGLFIRAIDQAGVVVAKSMSALFREVVPYLSTQNKENLSYKAMQSKTYDAEERDKQIVIDLLDKLKRIIDEF